MGQRTNITNKIIQRVKTLLGDKQNFTRHLEDFHSVNGDNVEYFMTLGMVDHETLSVHEIIAPQKGSGFQDLFWLFKLNNTMEWNLQSLSKNGVKGEESLILRELYDLFVRLNADESDNRIIKLEIPQPSQDFNRTFNPYLKRLYSYIYLLMGSALLVFGLFATLFVSNIQYNRMARIVNTLGLSISKSADGSESVIDSLARQVGEISQTVDLLLESKEMEQEAFEFNRFNMSTSIRQRADKLNNRNQYSMKRAYYYIADRVEDSTSYGELYYHFSRLPENNSQAETLLATDRDNIISLNRYNSPISYLLYPVRLDGGYNDGEGFMVSCGYMDMRLNPLGEGGGRPHYAVDIININNIIN
ncbi:MAG: hypothetical protein PF447_10365, partial [Spirochaetaceae bacterium]|nr:hypothetical protein [Spirochaetaceae bacterium]